MFFDAHEDGDGQLVLVTDYELKFLSLGPRLRQLTSVVSEYAVWTHSCAALHTGVVRSPEGEVVLLPTPLGDGKSTITCAFVAAGWDYLGDEAIGVRPETGVAVGYPEAVGDRPRQSGGALGCGPAGVGRRCGSGPVSAHRLGFVVQPG